MAGLPEAQSGLVILEKGSRSYRRNLPRKRKVEELGNQMAKKIRGDQQITSAGKILVVDDDEDFLWITDTMLQKAGYSVIQAKNGEKVLKLLEKDIPDLILMDYRLPNRSGLQVAADVKQRIPTVPIIMLTGYAEVGSAVEAMKMGVYDYVTKPIDNDDLLFTIKRCLEKQDLIEEVERLRKALA